MRITVHLLVVQDMPRLGRHAVDAPVGFAVLVTDCDREAAVVCADDLDVVLGLALHHQLLPLAGVARPDRGLQLACNNNVIRNIGENLCNSL